MYIDHVKNVIPSIVNTVFFDYSNNEFVIIATEFLERNKINTKTFIERSVFTSDELICWPINLNSEKIS